MLENCLNSEQIRNALRHDLILTATEMYLPNFISAPWLLLKFKAKEISFPQNCQGKTS